MNILVISAVHQSLLKFSFQSRTDIMGKSTQLKRAHVVSKTPITDITWKIWAVWNDHIKMNLEETDWIAYGRINLVQNRVQTLSNTGKNFQI